MSISPEISSQITPYLISALILGLLALGSWLRMKTAQWERMTEDARQNAAEAKKYSEGNRQLLESIERKSDGINERLVERNEKATFAAGKMKAELDRIAREHGSVNKDDLDEIEREFIKNVKPDVGK